MNEINAYSLPEYYDWISTGLDGDIAYYVKLAEKSGGPVLELGCGTGRCSLAIARAGIEVTGLDLSSEMLGRARKKAEEMGLSNRIRWVEGNMSRFDLGRRFPLIIIPYRSFLHLMTVKEQLTALAAIRRHLEEDGLFAFNIFVPKISDLVDQDRQMAYRGTFPIPGTDHSVEVYDWTEFDHFLQRARVVRYMERFDGEGRSLERLRSFFWFRYIYPAELFHLLRLAGFRVVNRYGDFEGHPFDRRSSELIVEAKKI
ncbi:MAG: class I SAM-dependent methyltransferase [Planifilum sp.]